MCGERAGKAGDKPWTRFQRSGNRKRQRQPEGGKACPLGYTAVAVDGLFDGVPGLWAAGVVLPATLLGTAALCRLAARWGLVAEPNARSSHGEAKPSGGGLAFVVPVLIVLGLSAGRFAGAPALLAGGAAIAALGLLDDRFELARSLRLTCHFAVTGVLVAWLFTPSALAGAVMTLGLAWWLNAYNFMDGIDGLAASQAIGFAAAALALGAASPANPALWALAAGGIGFLCFNWAPARIFMGDAGAGFLGLTTGALAVWLWRNNALPIAASAILLLTFWFDATYTLVVRVVTGQAFANAHRTHLYQLIAMRLGHGIATMLFWVHFLAWLAPLAAAAIAFPEWRLAALGVAAIPLAFACLKLRAGTAASGATPPGATGTA